VNSRWLIIIFFNLFFQLNFQGNALPSGDQDADSLKVYMDIQQAKNLINIGDYDSAKTILDHTSRISLVDQQWHLYFLSQTAVAGLLEKQGDLNDVVKIYIELIRLLDKNNQYELLAQAYAELGREYVEYELFKKAIGYYLLSNDYYEKSWKIQEKVQNLSTLGSLYVLTENFPQAEKSVTEAIALMRSGYPGKDISGLLTELVHIYEKMGDTEKMLEINLQLFEIAKAKSDLIAIAASLENLGYNYATLGDHEKALKYFQNAYHTNNLLNQPVHKKAAGLSNIGISLENLGRDQISIDTLRSALKLWEKENNFLEITELNTIIARIYLHIREYDAAEIYADAAIKAAGKTGDPEALSKCFETYSLIFQEKDDFERALFYHKKFLQLNDSLQDLRIARERMINQREFDAEKAEKELSLILADRELKDLMVRQMHLENESSQKEIALLRSSQELQELEKEKALQGLKLTTQELEAEKKDREIEYLQQQQELQRLALARKEAEEKEQKKTIQVLEQQSQLREQQLERTTLKRRLAFMTIALLVVILILIIIGYIQKRKDNKLLSSQKESILNINKELEDKNNEIASQRDKITHSFIELENTVEELKKTQNQLLEAEKMASIGQLTAGIAHEINNPINFVSSNISPLRMNLRELKEILETYRLATANGIENEKIQYAKELERKYDLDYLINEVDQLLEGIAEGASRTKEIVHGLRNFSRSDEHELKSASVHDGLDSTLLLLNNLLKNRIEVEKIYDENLQSIECYPGQLNQVFMNILNNAIQAIEGPGKITVKTRRIRNRAVIWISDSGKGIPREHMNRIFDPFFTTKEVGEGTGLGLSISYGIIQQHKGLIKVTSKPGKGTTFKISLPVRHPEE
jgi:signal transduction histidine kinase